ncbi:MAG: ATP-binding protein [Planctomycetes bacterium]|nr:ATP-binding protein [Planctomycetota bacterium]
MEELFHWADSYRGFMFASRRPSELLTGPGVEGAPLESLESVPHLLKEALGKGVAPEAIVSDMRSVGYPIEKIDVKKLDPLNTLIITVQEENIPCEIVQTEISAGMYRALSAVVILNYLLLQEMPCTLAVDDIGEGLDFERSANLIKLLLQKTKKSGIQLMLTSNDRHLLNAVDVQSWNILERKGGKVRAFNYANSKEAFDDFAMTGLSNFDFLSGRMYKETKAGP